MNVDFKIIRELLASLAKAERNAQSFRHVRGMPLQEEIRFDHLVALYENGLVDARDTSDERKRELTDPVLTVDGQDLLDALQSDSLWADVKRHVERSGSPLDLKTVKACVAQAITGGFNA
jgi:hypothetical protein